MHHMPQLCFLEALNNVVSAYTYNVPIIKLISEENISTHTVTVKLKHNRSLKVAEQGLDFMAQPLYIHTYIQ
jgi:hypothetical protein